MFKTPHVSLWEKANRIRAAIQRAYDYDSNAAANALVRRDPGINVEREDLEKAKRITDAEKGIVHMGRL